jgi:hypothetical protein
LGQRVHHTILERQHLTVVGLVVIAGQVQRAVDDGLDEVLGVVRADDDIAELAWPRRRPILVDRERQDVGRLVLAAVVAVQLLDALLVDQLDRQVAIGYAGGLESRLRRAPEARVVCLDLDQREARRRRSDVWREECSS